MTPFERFRQQVQDQPESVAVVTPYRVATYRKMWSRIERSTARLQAEWGIAAGDTIAYFGCGHLDALVMYLAAARCGARLLPLEHAALQQAAPAILAASGTVLVMHDDLLAPPMLQALPLGLPCRALSTLIATPCRHRESVVENSAVVSLLQWPRRSMAMQTIDDVADAMQSLQPHSLDALAAQAASAESVNRTDPADRPMPATVTGALFDAEVFGPLVLATLLTGRMLTFGQA